MKLGNYSVLLPLYRIESEVTYHTVRTPAVFERMLLRLCSRSYTASEMAELSLLEIFKTHLGIANGRDLLENCMSNLIALGAIQHPTQQGALECPLRALGLTGEGERFFYDNRLPVRAKKEIVEHLYDPIDDSVKSIKDRANGFARKVETDLEELLRPLTPDALVSRAIGQEKYPWKNPSTEIVGIVAKVGNTVSREQEIEVSCNEAGSISIRAPKYLALQGWLEQAAPEIVWQVLLKKIFELRSDSTNQKNIDSDKLCNALAIRPIDSISRSDIKYRLCVVSGNYTGPASSNIPIIALTAEVSQPCFIEKQLRIPAPEHLSHEFQSIFLAEQDAAPNVEISGAARLYWAGQPRVCGITVSLGKDDSNVLWHKVRTHLETICQQSDDNLLASLPVIWKGPREEITSWLEEYAKRLDPHQNQHQSKRK